MDHQLDPGAADSLEVPPLPPPPTDMVNLNQEELPLLDVSPPPEVVTQQEQRIVEEQEEVTSSLHIATTSQDHVSAEIVVSDKPAGFQSDLEISDAVKKPSLPFYDYTKSIQKCSSCGVEKATIICSNCRPLGQQSNFGMDQEINEDNKCVALSLNADNPAEKTNLSIELDHNKTQPSSSSSSGLRNKISVESLIKNGNMLYCQDCFLFLHETMKNTHLPIELKYSKSMPSASNNSSGIQIAPISTVEQQEVEEEPKTPAHQPAVTFDTLNQSTVEMDKEQKRLDKERMKSGLDKLMRELDMLKRRQLEFNGVKTSIKHMNETIKEDLMLDFSAVADQMKSKLDEITSKIKEKLKDAYSVIRDMHDKIPARLEEINKNMKELEHIVLNDDHIYSLEEMQTNYARKSQEVVDQINQLNGDLRLVCEHYKSYGNTSAMSASGASPVLDVNHNNLFMHTLNSTTSPPSMSLFVEDRLYPQINYLVDLTQLKDIIDNICVQINSPEANKSRHELMNKYSHIQLVSGLRLFCTAMTGLSNDGSFWIHVIGEARIDETASNSNETGVEELPSDINIYDPVVQQKLLIQYGKERIKSNMFLEEISKTIRRLRIGRRELKTFSEMNDDESGHVAPRVDQKCFCYDQRSQKWLRARIVSVDTVRKECQIKYMDTGANDEGRLPGFDSIIDADLVSQFDEQVHRLPYRSLKCYLHKAPQYLYPSPPALDNAPSLALPDCASTPLLPNALHNLNVLNQEATGDSVDKYEKNISLDTRYIFKDITLNKNLLCELIERVDNDPERDVESWTIKLTYVKAESSGSSSSGSPSVKRGSIDSINKRIISHNTVVNNKQAENQNPFSCTDIRLATGQVGATNTCERPGDETQNESRSEIKPVSTASSVTSPMLKSPSPGSQVVLTDKTEFFQTDETRLCSEREGECVLYSQLSRYGTFWIRPLNCDIGDDVTVIRNISHVIDTVMSRGSEIYQSYSQMRKSPKTGDMCVIRLRASSVGGRITSNRWEWHRGLIENLDSKKERCSVRQLDRGSYKETYWSDTYPLTESLRDDLVAQDPNMKKYLSIRCTLFNRKIRIKEYKVLDEFDKLTTCPAKSKINVFKFRLVEQIQCDQGYYSHWYTHLYNVSGANNSFNQAIYQMLPSSDRFCVKEPNMFDNIPKREEQQDWLAHVTPSLPVGTSADIVKPSLRPIASMDDIKLLVSSAPTADNEIKNEKVSDEVKSEIRKSQSLQSINESPNQQSSSVPHLVEPKNQPEQTVGSKSLSSDSANSQLCFKCYERGHHQRDCQQKSIRKCHTCHQAGHLARNCPNKNTPLTESVLSPIDVSESLKPSEPTSTTQVTPKTSEKEENKSNVSRKGSGRSRGGCKPDTDSHKGDHHKRRDDDHQSPCRRFAAAFPDQAQGQSGTGSRSARYSNRRGGGAAGGGNNRTANVMSSDDELLDDGMEIGRGVLMSEESDAVFEDSIEHHAEPVVRSGGLVDDQQQNVTLATRSWLRSLHQDHMADFEAEQRERNRRLMSDLENEENNDDMIGSLINKDNCGNLNCGANGGLDITQPVDNRHALLLESAAPRHQDDDNYSMISSTTSSNASSTTTGSLDSLKKAKQMLSDNDESFASCTDEIQNAPAVPAAVTPGKPSSTINATAGANLDGNNTNPQTATPSNNQTVTTITTNHECSNCGNDKSKLERMKQFKVAIFVESFDDYSFSSSSLTNQNSQSSLREFEQIEMATGLDNNNNSTSLSNSRLMANDDEFMFESNPNYDYILNSREAKPPLSVSTLPLSAGSGNSNNVNRMSSLHNVPSNLSTISECTNETYNDSNHSRDRLPSANLNHQIDHPSTGLMPAPLSPSAYALVNSDETTSDAAVLGAGGERHVTKRRHRSGSRRDGETLSTSNPISFEIQGNNADIRQAIHRLIDKARDIQVSLIDENKSSLEIIGASSDMTSNSNLPLPPPPETINQSNSLLPSIDVTDKLFAEFSQQLGESILGLAGQTNQGAGSLIRTNNSHMVEEMLNETVSLDKSILNQPGSSLPPKTPPARGTPSRSMFNKQAPAHQDSTSSTLEISSYTMESMNSNFVVTPLVSQSTNGANFVTISVSPRHPHQSNQAPSGIPLSLPSPRSISMTLPLPSPPTFILNPPVQNQSHQQQQVPVYSSQNFISPTTAGTLTFTSPLPPPPAPPLPPNGIFNQSNQVKPVEKTTNATPSPKPGLINTIKAQLQERKLGTSGDKKNVVRKEEESVEARFETGKMTLYGLDNEEEQPVDSVTSTNNQLTRVSPPEAPPVPENLFEKAKANLKPVARNNNTPNSEQPAQSSLVSLGSDSIFLESSEKSSESSSSHRPSTKTDTVSSRQLPVSNVSQRVVKEAQSSTPSPKQPEQQANKSARYKTMPHFSKLPTSSPKSCPDDLINKKPTAQQSREEDNDSVYSSMSSRQCLSETQRAEMPPSEFKLDHLSDINPKRLYESCKFRCRIHDVIDKSGCFGLEVIYPDEDEKKFKQLFKLFRLSSAINKPPARLHRLQRVSAFYRDNWHRAVVLSDSYILDDKFTSIIEVKFVDLGIRRSVNRYEQVREIDDKFFNFPLKSVYCTVSVDDELRTMLAAEMNQRRELDKMCLSLEARKFFTRQVYGKLLYAKVIGLREQEPIKLILGAQTKRGIIDVFMYTMSKYDRSRYELIKQLHNKTRNDVVKTNPITQNNLDMLLIQQQKMSTKQSYLTPDESLETTLTNECQSEETMSMNSQVVRVLCSDDGGPRDNLVDCCYSENFDEYEDYEDQEEDTYDGFDETDSALFSHLIDYVTKATQKANDFEYGLDLTPVSEKKSNSQLHIDSVHLTSKTAPVSRVRNMSTYQSPRREHVTPVRSGETNDDVHQKSTAQCNSRNRMIRAQLESKHQTPLLPQGRVPQSPLSDTDSSLSQVNCCQLPVGLKQKLIKELSKSKSQTMDLSSANKRPQVKFMTN